jgi:hypothetical protein
MAGPQARRSGKREAPRSAAWREVIRSKTPARRSSARLVLDALLLDAMARRLDAEIARTLEMQVQASKLAERAGTLLDLLHKRLAEIDDFAKTKTGALN